MELASTKSCGSFAPSADVVPYLTAFGYDVEDRCTWRQPSASSEEGPPRLTFILSASEKTSGTTRYLFGCSLTGPGCQYQGWKCQKRLEELRQALHDHVKDDLGPNYKTLFADAHFPFNTIAGGMTVPGTTARLCKWVATLAYNINRAKISPSAVAYVLEYFEAHPTKETVEVYCPKTGGLARRSFHDQLEHLPETFEGSVHSPEKQDSGRSHRSEASTCVASSASTVGSSYSGDRVEGKRHGFGVQMGLGGCPHALIYEGCWKDGVAHGRGKRFYESGNCYDGEFEKGKFHGHGMFKWHDGVIYDGQFCNGKKQGKGVTTLNGSIRYEGEHQLGHVHGKGQMYFLDGRIYTGQFVSGDMHGHGEVRYPDGSVYIGHMENGQQSKKGARTSPNGERCAGQLFKEVGHGFGVMRTADGVAVCLRQQLELDLE